MSVGYDGTLPLPRTYLGPQPKRAQVRCKGCGAQYPTALCLSPHGWIFDAHLQMCPARPLRMALENLKRFAEEPPAEYIVDQELAYIKRLIDANRPPPSLP